MDSAVLSNGGAMVKMSAGRLADICFGVLALMLVGFSLASYRSGVSGSAPEVFPAGTVLSVPDRQKSLAGSVILVFQSDCPFCIESVAFYRRLAAHCVSLGVPFGVVTTDPPALVRASLGMDDGEALEVLWLPSVSWPGTPAIVLVDRDNRVRASWLGRLNSRFEERVIDAITRLAD